MCHAPPCANDCRMRYPNDAILLLQENLIKSESTVQSGSPIRYGTTIKSVHWAARATFYLGTPYVIRKGDRQEGMWLYGFRNRKDEGLSIVISNASNRLPRTPFSQFPLLYLEDCVTFACVKIPGAGARVPPGCTARSHPEPACYTRSTSR